MEAFTQLERDVLEAVCRQAGDSAQALRTMLASARVTVRENTGHGFFTSFDVDRDRPLEWTWKALDGGNWDVKVGGAVLGMGFVLWTEEGYPDCLEGFSSERALATRLTFSRKISAR